MVDLKGLSMVENRNNLSGYIAGYSDFQPFLTMRFGI